MLSHRLHSQAYTSKCARPALFGCSNSEEKVSVQQLAGGEGQRVFQGDKSCVNEWVLHLTEGSGVTQREVLKYIDTPTHSHSAELSQLASQY